MKMGSVSFRAAFLLGFGCATLISANVEITSNGKNGTGFSKGSEAILTCTINPYSGSQTWKVDGVSVADCGFVVCSENMSNPERYSFTPNISTGIFVFTINPIDSADNGIVDCFDGSSTETFVMVVTEMEQSDDYTPSYWCKINPWEGSCIILICVFIVVYFVQFGFALNCIFTCCTICTTCTEKQSSIKKGSKGNTRGNANGTEMDQPNTWIAKTDNLQMEIECAVTQSGILEHEIKEKKKRWADLQLEIEETNTKHDVLQWEIKNTRVEHDVLQQKKEKRQKEHDDLRKIEKRQEEHDVLQQKKEKRQKEPDDLKRKQKENQERIDDLMRKINEKQIMYDDLQKQINEKREEYNNLHSEINEKKVVYDNLQREITEKKEELDDLQREQNVACLIRFGFVPFLGIITLIAAFCFRKNLCKTESQRANTRTW